MGVEANTRRGMRSRSHSFNSAYQKTVVGIHGRGLGAADHRILCRGCNYVGVRSDHQISLLNSVNSALHSQSSAYGINVQAAPHSLNLTILSVTSNLSLHSY